MGILQSPPVIFWPGFDEKHAFNPGRSPRPPYFGAEEDDEEPIFLVHSLVSDQDQRGRRDKRSNYGSKRDYQKNRPNY
ncbi:unnamed protein product, partial [Mesorhabditis belari]|uniref:Uncharacterized protein n=1 Tax=Mesorhabditis belari TaxID=2138241 RepID=A0AAF3EH13_9BILA